MENIRRAYAVLGLPNGASLATVKGKYRALVRNWHPDRFVADPQGQAEAAARMRLVNEAYTTLADRLSLPKTPAHTLSGTKFGSSRPDATQRLSQEEIDALVQAVQSIQSGPIDTFFGMAGWVGRTVEGVFGVLFLLGFLVHFGRTLWRGNWGEPLHDFELPFILAAIAVLAAREYFQRRRLAAAFREVPPPARAGITGGSRETGPE